MTERALPDLNGADNRMLRFILTSIIVLFNSPLVPIAARSETSPGTLRSGARVPMKGPAASVHLWYPFPKGDQVNAFLNEVTVRKAPVGSYFMACGFSRGYFGIQVNSLTERRIIFSVWDSGREPADRSRVPEEDRVQVLGKGDDVVVSSFGNEGTGAHSHQVYPWKVGKTYRLLVTAKAEGTFTVYTAWFFFPERRHWGMIARFQAPHDGSTLRGLYSFIEDFDPTTGGQERWALYGPQWAHTVDGRWLDLTTARFTHTANGFTDRPDRGAGVKGDRFFLMTGSGKQEGKEEALRYGAELRRRASRRPPQDVPLP